MMTYEELNNEEEEAEEAVEEVPEEEEVLQVGNDEMRLKVDARGREYMETTRASGPKSYEWVERNRHTGEIEKIGDRVVEYEKKTSGGYKMTKIGDKELVKDKWGTVVGIGGGWKSLPNRVNKGEVKEFLRPKKKSEL